jgi:cell division cycle 2-like
MQPKREYFSLPALCRNGEHEHLRPKSRWSIDEDVSPVAPPGDASAGASRKRKFSPEVTDSGQPKAIRAGMSMAERAAAELEEFRRRQAELTSDNNIDAYALKSSPDVSSPEEEQHIRREGNSYHHLPRTEDTRGDSEQEKSEITTSPAARGMPSVFPPAEDGEGGEEEEEEEEEEHVVGPSLPQQGSDFVVDAYPEAPSEEDSPGASREHVEEEAIKPIDGAADHRGSGPPPPEMHVQSSPSPDARSFLPGKRVLSMLDECRSVDKHYEKLNRISEGTYGVVYRAREMASGRICALKRVKLDNERDGFPLTSIREINVLLSLSHPSIVNVSEVVVGDSLDQVFMVMEYADHDLRGVMEKRMNQPFTIAEVKCLMQQLLAGVAYLHDNWVLHRDLKTSNILYTNRGELKVCDFGLARQYADPLRPYTHMVVTLWYRAPELLLGTRVYTTPVDVWSCGCIMAELLTKQPIFKSQTELGQLDQIFRILGVPDEHSWPGLTELRLWKSFNFKGSKLSSLRHLFPRPGPVFDGRPTLSDSGFDLLSGLLTLCPVGCQQQKIKF